MTTIEIWSTQQLAALLSALSDCLTEREAVERAVARIAESCDAEACAYLVGDSVVAFGFPAGRVPVDQLSAVAVNDQDETVLTGIGPCSVLTFPVPVEPLATVVVARTDGPFDATEVSVLRGMGRVLALALRMLRSIADVRARQLLLERLSAVQNAILSREPLERVLDMVTSGASAALGGGGVGLLEVDEGRLTLMSAHDLPPRLAELGSFPVDKGVAGSAVVEGRLVVAQKYADVVGASPHLLEQGVTAAMAAPVRVEGRVVGALVTVTTASDRIYEEADKETLTAFAHHASLALNDVRTRQAMHRALDDAMHQALHDALTGLPNRALFTDRLQQALSGAQRRRDHVGVLFVDLDNFKMVNDSLGHVRGDELLVAVADRITSSLRACDTAARFGGDEFAIVVTELDGGDGAAAAAARLQNALAAPFTIAGEPLQVEASIGVVVSDGTHDAEELLLNADVAMYDAKSAGKGRASMFRPAMHTALVARLEMEGALRRALDRDELSLAYQPIVDMRDGAILGVEALLRWTHSTRGPISPAEFVPVAEETRLIIPIGLWVLERACREVLALEKRHGRTLSLSVNLSALQAQDAGLVADVAGVLSSTGFDPRRLTLEITESVFMHDTAAIIATLEGLSEQGIRLALDDFGTGFSSLRYLQRFPIDALKVDKSFVDGLADDVQDHTLTHAIVRLGQTLGLETVAEGVETDEQRSRLLEMGCTVGQGFFFARPLPPAGLGELLGGASPAPANLGQLLV